MFVVGVCPQGVFWACAGGGWPPFRRLASHKSVPLFTLGFQAGRPPPAPAPPGPPVPPVPESLRPGSGEFGISQPVS